MRVFDCDIHQTFTHQSALYDYLPERFVERVKRGGLGYPSSPYTSPLSYKRSDATPPKGPAGSDKTFLIGQLFETMGVEAGILNGSGVLSVSYIPEIEYPLYLANAYNEWMIDHWLTGDERFYGSLHIALQHPEGSAEMIRRLGKHPAIKQVTLPSMTPLPLSHPAYKPVLKAIADTDLALALHIWQPGITTQVSTPLGNPSNYVEWKCLSGLPNITHLVNMIFSGIFEEYENLRCVYLEGGYSWLIYFKHRMEQLYKSFRSDVPWLKHSPEFYLHRNCRFVTQPVEEFDKENMFALYRAMDAGKLLMYSSDYPHWDADNPVYTMKWLPPEDKEAIMFGNAKEFYKLTL